MDCVGADAFVRPPSEARITQPTSSVSGERRRILLLVRTARSLRRPCCEVRPLRAKAQSVTDCSLTKVVRKTRGRLRANRNSVSGEVHGNFAACLWTQAGVRAPNRDPSSLAATAVAARVFCPRCTQGRLHAHLRTGASPCRCIAVEEWPFKGRVCRPHESGL